MPLQSIDNSASSASIRQPSQVDFALLTINDSEDQAVRDVFDTLGEVNRCVGDRGIYSWGTIDGEKEQFVIVHASACDIKGPIPAIRLIRELDRRFRPHHLLVLGTAGGIKEKSINYGQVVFSRQIHAGYQQLLDSKDAGQQVEVRLYDDPVQPPFDRLYFHAKKAAISWQPTDELRNEMQLAIAKIRNLIKKRAQIRSERLSALDDTQSDSIDEPWVREIAETLLGEKSLNRPQATEIFSGSYLIDGNRSQLFQSIKKTFPKVGAVEMEAGAVAQAVLHSIETDRFLGYLIIKGISDVVDSEVPSDYRKEVRKSLSSVASRASAEFALELIKSWQTSSNRSIGRLSLLPPKYSATFDVALKQKQSSNSVVYDEISLVQYSQVLEGLARDGRINSVWTFCYLAPYRFFAEIPTGDATSSPESTGTQSERSKDESINRAKKVLRANPDRTELKRKLLQEFPHFGVFTNLDSKKVVRVMHAAKDGKQWREDNQEFLEAFSVVNGEANGSVQCFVLNDDDLRGEDRWQISDQVVLNEELLLDFNNFSRRLVVTYLDPHGLREAFIRFREHCRSRCTPEKQYKIIMKGDVDGPSLVAS